MKIQCSCGAKYAFDITPDMANHPVKFVCPACGLDASQFVNGLVQQELARRAPAAPMPVATPVTPPPQPAHVRLPVPEPVQATAVDTTSCFRQPCSKHPGQVATEQCYVCRKPICPKCMELFGHVCSPLCKARAESQGIHVPVYAGQKSVVEAKFWRKVGSLVAVIGVVIAGVLGVWFWYAWFGSVPKPVFSVRFPEPVYSGESAFAGPDQIVFLRGGTLARYDMKLNRQIWSRDLLDHKQIEAAVAAEVKAMQAAILKAQDEGGENIPKMPSAEKLTREIERAAGSALQLLVRGSNVWVSTPDKLVRYDYADGKPVKEIPSVVGFAQLVPRGDELRIVGGLPGNENLTRINLATGETHAEQIPGVASAPPPRPGAMPLLPGVTAMAGLPLGVPGKDAGKSLDPAKVAEQAQRLSAPAQIALPALLANSQNQERIQAELDGRSDRPGSTPAPPALPEESQSLVPGPDGFVLVSVRLLESRLVQRSAMKAPPKKSALDGAVTVAKTADVANEILNEMQRSRGGDVVTEDESRYQVTLRSPGGTEGASWSGEVIGPPTVFPLQTVNVLAANKTILVFDERNQKLWQSSLNFNVTAGPGALEPENAPYGQGPCVERKDRLYVFDAGVLTAFDLATGNALWRLPSVGIVGLFFDDQGMIYLNTTTASPDSIRYSRQIDITEKAAPVVLKIDSHNGKVLWTAQPGGAVRYVSGKFIYTLYSYAPPEPDEDSPVQTETGLEKPASLAIRRINPRNGALMWEYGQPRAPLDVQFDHNRIRLVFKKEVQVLKFLSL